ncbi:MULTISPECIES: SPOR domain-containing protein [Luteibacter]|uniref:SPOR domain-containing protein n=1 Tax=Luteibacter flocculans TaxID=2780091 RepID=A0ABY4T3N7_9GAMM|nr:MULTISPECIES: SPOR domain-containing protein [Luteibacter]URL58722.1 SPOR domain-containing protein [Luteibacter flocculans]SFW67463.1 cell division protein FtsN [Luteibacter sp. UNCMF366Tsu5.1]
MATRKKGKGRQAVRNGSSGMPGWSWALIGILAGALLMAFAMRGAWMPMMRQHDGPEPNPNATAQKSSDPGVVDQAEPEKPKKPSYDFYSVLSEKEVRIPDAEIRAQASAEAQQKQQQQQAAQQQAQAQQAAVAQQQAQANAAAANLPKATTQTVTAVPAQPAPAAASAGSGYLLQVGAFPSASDAEALKAKLALQGFVANVQSVKVGAQTYNRVRLGPFKSATELESTKQRLQSAGISAIALKEGS